MNRRQFLKYVGITGALIVLPTVNELEYDLWNPPAGTKRGNINVFYHKDINPIIVDKGVLIWDTGYYYAPYVP